MQGPLSPIRLGDWTEQITVALVTFARQAVKLGSRSNSPLQELFHSAAGGNFQGTLSSLTGLNSVMPTAWALVKSRRRKKEKSCVRLRTAHRGRKRRHVSSPCREREKEKKRGYDTD